MIEKRKQVYVVDNDPDDRFLICEALRQVSNQINIIEAVDGIDLFEIIGQQEPHGESVVLLDVNMPRMNGLETLEKIRSEPSLTGMPVVIFSTSANPELITEMQLSAIDTFVQKPNTFEGYIALATQISSTLSAAQ